MIVIATSDGSADVEEFRFTGKRLGVRVPSGAASELVPESGTGRGGHQGEGRRGPMVFDLTEPEEVPGT